MASKRDQLQSYQFVVQRAVSALVIRESDPEHPPFRRPILSALWSVAIGVIVLTVIGIYGFVVPAGKTSWQAGDAVIVEKETGTRYVYVDGRLHPATNYASALLALGKEAKTRTVSRNSLTGVPRGPEIGIVDAPDALPGPKRLLTGPWTLCSEPAVDSSGGRINDAVLMIGEKPSGGVPIEDQAVLVTDPRSRLQYLLLKGYRHEIKPADAGVVALALDSEPWTSVSNALIESLPMGEAIRPIALPGAGTASTAVPTRRSTLKVGQLLTYRPAGGGLQHYLAERTRLRQITALQFDIQMAYGPTARAYGGKAPRPVELSPIEVSESVVAPLAEPKPGVAPAARPKFAPTTPGGSPVCASFESGAAVPDISIDGAMPPKDAMMATAGRTAGGVQLADRVLVRPGWGALVDVRAAPDAPSGTLALVTDLGRAYVLSAPEVLKQLGYAGAAPVRVPATLFVRVPQGSVLDPAVAAKQPISR